MAEPLLHLARVKPDASGVSAAISCCGDITDRFERELKRGRWKKKELAQRFTSGITEAIVRATLLQRGSRKRADLIRDARLRVNDQLVTERNIDFFWARPAASPNPRAEAYECKTDPIRFFMEFVGLSVAPDRQKRAEWKNSQYYMMQQLKKVLESKGIPTRLGVVTLLTHGMVKRRMRALPASVPRELVYYCEDIFSDLTSPDPD